VKRQEGVIIYLCMCACVLCVTGKSDPYCEITMGAQEHKTKVIPNTLNPKWNASMQFTIRDLHEDVLCITVYDRDLFTPNGMHRRHCVIMSLGSVMARASDLQSAV